MRRRLGVIGLVVLLAAAVVAVWFGLVGAGDRQRVTVTIIAPPAGVVVPAGQAVEVRYRVKGPADRAELWCDDTLLATDSAPVGHDLMHAWVPAGPGAACCTVIALDGRGARLVSARCCLTVGSDGSPVRLGGPSE